MIIDNSDDILTAGFAAFDAFLTHSVGPIVLFKMYFTKKIIKL